MAGPLKRKLRAVWSAPDQPAADVVLSEATRGKGLMEQLRALGSFSVPGASTPSEELSVLLQVAAEVEQALLLQYLYSAYSIDENGVGASAEARQKILDVAIQEMAHLITVQNLILAVDGPDAFHIGRETVRTGNQFNPFPFLLEPLTKLSLAKYIIAEMPGTFPPSKLAKVERIRQLQQEVLAASGLQPERVGALYAKIYWLIQPTDTPTGPLSLQVDKALGYLPGWHIPATQFQPAATIQAHDAVPNEWRVSSGRDLRIHQMSDAATALVALNSVMEQGEGISHAQDSHFYEFLEVLDLFEAGQITVRSVPTNPFVGQLPPGVTSGTQIQHAYARLWANLGNLRYTTLMLDIGHSLSLARPDADRPFLVGTAFRNMRRLRQVIDHLTSSTMQAIDANSAPTFELLREDLPSTPRDRWLRQRELVETEERLSAELFARPELAADLEGKDLLDTLSADRNTRKAKIDERLAS